MSDCTVWWQSIAISGVTFIFYILPLIGFYIMLSRKIDKHSCHNEARSSGSTEAKQEPLQTPPAAAGDAPRVTYEDDSETSSETSEDSDSSPPARQGPTSQEGVNYTTLLFAATGRGTGSSGDYENMKTATDYVNVDPKKQKVDFWVCSSPTTSKSIEYTEVKL
ncbi:PREDICTED: uncharacterized protein C1orf186 homolog [Crocodylus porosus]|uniref:uncharacterized protein C1orf186 homolog n=1 Tax=Crocodylus porosus TaxID=8502 RepID=UPI00093C057B|nr:PREDICTED: uncharacterized protein C1orf186 homolog [Crocodylus porosus]XP_019402082.1 PREDICTED: uncharacterized protein C1orf186 homolog [Crocodylus porosus]XP_019402083.1 PREDICTED: uncharacterized protein C1orf186 homolog [Crocodylus porosus]XP_019402084.1 PREDICTED: uncharacterized protein C1orf186 homolog [Crocodylus porosus]